jgi:hypothetical protein
MEKRLRSYLSILFVLSGFVSLSQAWAVENQKEWTFLIYLNGNNNLDSFGKYNINQMEKVGSTDRVNVVVQWASIANGKTQRLLVQKDNDSARVSSPVVEDMGKVDMGDWRNLVSFIEWGVKNYPAQHYFIDVWNHGSGWHDLKLKAFQPSFNPLDISLDDNTGHSITTPQLGQALNEAARIIGHKVDVYGSDACLMAMVEVASEMKNSVKYYLGSQDLEPGEGWPYDAILSQWNKKSATTAQEVAKIVTEEYVKSYQGGQNGDNEVTFSVFDLEKTDRLYSALDFFSQRLKTLDPVSRKKVVQIFGKSQMFYYSDYRDLLDFVDQLEKAPGTPLVDAKEMAEVKNAASDYLVINATTRGFRRAQGISIWMPGRLSTYNSHSKYYNTLQFQTDTKWGDVLRDLLQSAAATP